MTIINCSEVTENENQHGRWLKDEQRYEDGCKENRSHTLPQRCAPSDAEVRDAMLNAVYVGLRWADLTDEAQTNILTGVRAVLRLFVTQPTVEQAKAEGWDECVSVFEKNFFAGPTKDMVLGWLKNPYRKENNGRE